MMQAFIMLVRRNMNMYLKNRTNVIFSFISMMIILGLNIVFLGKVNEGYLSEGFHTLTSNQVTYITGSWLMAGIVIVNVVTVNLAALGVMVQDEEEHKLAAFLVTPISRSTLILSYIVAACMSTFLFGIITLIFSQIYLYLSCGNILSWGAFLKLLLIILAMTFSVVTFFSCITTLVRDTSAFSVLASIVGTLIGFVAGIYLPMGTLSQSIQNVLKMFPILYGTSLARQVYTQDACMEAFKNMPEELIDHYKTFMGITIKWGDQGVSFGVCLLILIGSGIIFTIIAGILLKHKKASDR